MFSPVYDFYDQIFNSPASFSFKWKLTRYDTHQDYKEPQHPRVCKSMPSLYWHLGVFTAKFDLSLATLPCISVQWLRSHQVYIFDQKEHLAGRIVSNWAVEEVLFLCHREMHVLPLLVASAASLEPRLERICVLTYGTVVQVFGAVAQKSMSIVVTVLPLFPPRVSLCICLIVCT